MKRLSISILLFLLANFLTAQVSMKPNLKNISIGKNGQTSFKVFISNSGDSKESCEMSAINMDVSETGVPFISDTSYSRSVADWMTFEPAKFEIPAHGEKELAIKIKAPQEAAGSYCAMYRANFSPAMIPLQEGQQSNTKSSLKLGRSWAGVVLVTVRSFGNEVKMVPRALRVHSGRPSFYKAENLTESGGWKVEVEVFNEGNTLAMTQGYIQIFSETGIFVESSELEVGRGVVLPERARKFQAIGNRFLPDGLYLVKAFLMTKKGKSLEHSIPFGVYEGQVYMGIESERMRDLIQAATPGFQIKDQFKTFHITANGKTFGSILLRNLTNDILTVFPRITGWWIGEEGRFQISDLIRQNKRSCTSWVEMSEDSILLSPKSSYAYRLKIMPPELLDGEYYAAVVFDPPNVKPDLSVQLIAGRTCFISALDKRTQRDSLTVGDVQPERTGQGEYELQFKIHNSGNSSTGFLGTIRLSKETAPGFFESVGESQKFGSTGSLIMPDSYRIYRLQWANLQPGKYETVITVELPEVNKGWSRFQRFVLE